MDEELVQLGLRYSLFSENEQMHSGKKGLTLSKHYLSEEELVKELWTSHSKHVEYRYQANTPFERLAIEDVSIDIPTGDLYGDYRSYRFRKINGSAAFKCLIQPTEQ